VTCLRRFGRPGRIKTSTIGGPWANRLRIISF
jgi:hypothetical protein